IVGTEIKKGAWLPSAVPADVTKEHCPNTSSHKMGDLSKTSMNMYVSCPRAYMFSELVVTPDSENTVFGNMIHEFAEFCACYPKIAKENIDECVRMISDVYAGISCPERKEFDLSRITSAVTNVEKFIDLLNVSVPLNVDARSKKHMNRFFERFGLTMTSDIVECDRRSSKYPMHGGFDLLIGNKVIDHKSGRMPKTSEIIDKMEISEKKDHFEFQPLVYLSILDDILERPGEREFVLFYAAGNETDLSGSFDVMKNTRNVTLLNMHKPDIIKSGMLLDIVTEAKSKEFIRDIGEGFNNALLEAGIDNAESWKNDETLIERIIALQSKRTKAVTDAIRSAVKKAGEIMSGCYINDGSRILIPRETIEQFKEYAKKIHARADGQQITGFPYEPRISCDRCVFFHICTGGRPDDA
ncbi:MAG: PD-(D/E)XK nuclease family protein, partial [Methanomassiliicoccaceae archaeon]|nr:PD-(D/E)XK nuclease family protein [Methanomassiliicoccaceae archaeon]